MIAINKHQFSQSPVNAQGNDERKTEEEDRKAHS